MRLNAAHLMKTKPYLWNEKILNIKCRNNFFSALVNITSVQQKSMWQVMHKLLIKNKSCESDLQRSYKKNKSAWTNDTLMMHFYALFNTVCKHSKCMVEMWIPRVMTSPRAWSQKSTILINETRSEVLVRCTVKFRICYSRKALPHVSYALIKTALWMPKIEKCWLAYIWQRLQKGDNF